MKELGGVRVLQWLLAPTELQHVRSFAQIIYAIPHLHTLPTHSLCQVRSCTLDTWLPEQVELMERVGNATANSIYEACLPLVSVLCTDCAGRTVQRCAYGAVQDTIQRAVGDVRN